MDEILVSCDQMMHGGRPPSPIEEFLREAGLSNQAAQIITAVPKLIVSVGPKTLMSLLKIVNWVRNVRTFAEAFDDIASVFLRDIGDIQVADDAYKAIKNLSPLERLKWIPQNTTAAFSLRSIANSLSLGLTGDSDRIPTVAAELFVDFMRELQNLAIGAHEETQ